MRTDRRSLKFGSLFEVMPEVNRLLQGHRTVGGWSLGQVLNHLASGIILSMDGFPDPAPWIIRRTIGPIARRQIFQKGRMPDGVKLPKKYEPKPGVDARAEAEALRAAIQLFGTHGGPWAEHPLLGPLSQDQWEKFHTMHSAHHLGFVLPD
jgi:hypothetical protein